MKRQLEEFAQRTTLHGCARTTSKNKYRILRFAWICGILAMASLLIYQITNLHNTYMAFETTNKVDMHFQSRLMFPAVTICNLSPYSKKYINVTPELENYLLAVSSTMYRFALPINWTEPKYRELEEEDITEWHERASIKLEEMFRFCSINNRDVNCSEHLTPTETDLGRCFTFNMNGNYFTRHSGYESGLSVIINTQQAFYTISSMPSAGIMVIVHEPGMHPEVHKHGNLIGVGTETHVQLQNNKFRFLPYPYKTSGNQYCVDTHAKDFVNPLKYPKYSRYGCLYECMYNTLFKKCGCAPLNQAEWWNMPTCNRRQMLECILRRSREGKRNDEEITEDSTSCECGYRCIENQYDATISSAASPSLPVAEYFVNHSVIPSGDHARHNFIYLRVFLKNMITKEVVYEAKQTPQSILAALGGIMGLLLGSSCLTLLEIAEFAFVTVLECISRKFSGQKIGVQCEE